MKPAQEIYKALEKVDEKLGVMTRTIMQLERRIENIKTLTETKDDIQYLKQCKALDDAIETFSGIAIEEISDLELAVTEARKISIHALGEPEAEEGQAPAGGEVAEDKQKILDKLYFVLKDTRAGVNVLNLIDDKDGTMTIYFSNGATKKVNIECDSGIAMIVDVCRALM